MATETPVSTRLQWKWVLIGTVIGVILATFLFYIMAETFNTYYVPAFIALLSFVLMGIIIGYNSPGYTIREPALGGLLAMIITMVIVRYVFDYNPPAGQTISAPILGFFLALLGGWVGEELQGSKERSGPGAKIVGLEWAWIITGTVVGFILNNIVVFFLFALLAMDITGVLIAVCVGFLVTGMIVGYKSPGVTIKEAGFAGLLGVLLNFIFTSALLQYSSLNLLTKREGFTFSVIFDVPWEGMWFILISLATGFVLSLIGGWIGEMLQKMMWERRKDNKLA
ncbi:MAG: hypothetical protein V1754_09565 [Pseudomonadota bacterium]